MSDINNLQESLNQTGVQVKGLKSRVIANMDETIAALDKIEGSLPDIESDLATIQKQIQDNEDRIHALKDEKIKLSGEIKTVEESIQQSKDQITELGEYNTKLESSIQQLDSNATQEKLTQTRVTTETEQEKQKIQDLSARLEAKKNANENEFKEKQLHLEQLNRETKQLKENDPVIAFLLAEGNQNLPEVEIIRMLAQQPIVKVDAIKQNVSLAPALVSRTLLRLQQAKILDFDESNGIVKLTINI